MRSTRLFALLGGLAVGAGIGAAPFAVAATAHPRALEQHHLGKALTSPVRPNRYDPSRELELFIRLSKPAVSEFVAKERSDGRVADRSAQIAQARKIAAEQAAFRKLLKRTGVKELSALRVGVNGLRVRGRVSDIARLQALPGVRSVAPVTTHHPDLEFSVPWVGAPDVWPILGNGTGIRVAIIDTGIDYTHANFGGSGNPNDFAGNNPNVIELGSFPTAKVAGGFDFAGANYDASNPALDEPTPDDDPLDGAAHGSHVAGITAGFGVEGNIGPGMAPGALLYSVKVFGDTGGSTNLTSEGIEWSLDPNGDGSMDDHLDVINMSLGSEFGAVDDPSSLSATNAVQNGIIVVASAGNSGDVPYITGAPGVGLGVISVASSISGGRVVQALQTITTAPGIAELHHAEEGDGPVRIENAPRSNNMVASKSETDDGLGNPIPGTEDNLGCHPFTNGSEFRGKIAFVRRGICTFLVKYQNAQAVGATAIVVYNDAADPDRVEPIIMGGLGGTTIPGLMISSTSGFQLFDALNEGYSITGNMAGDIVTDGPTELNDTISVFSSRGPGHGGSTFSPDITAPGDGIVSTDMGTGTGGVAFSGTSMAAPHVAGAAALLKQKYPTEDPLVIRALLMNSTETAHIEGPGSNTPYAIARQGTGVLRVDRAASLTSTARPAGIRFGYLNPAEPVREERTVVVRNMSDQAYHYDVTHVPNQVVPGVTVNCPAALDAEAGQRVQTSISLDYDPAQGVADEASFTQTEADGWCVFNNGVEELRMAYIAVVDPASRIGAQGGEEGVMLANLGPSWAWAEGFTLAGLDGENLDGVKNAIKATGFRFADPANFEGSEVIEFALATESRWEVMNDLAIEIYIDHNEDGVDDVLLEAADASFFGAESGPIFTAQSPLDAQGNPLPGFTDWQVVGADYHDNVAVLPFSNDDVAGRFLPAGDTSFGYRIEVTDLNKGTTDVQRGRIDLTQVIVLAESASYGLDAGESLMVGAEGPGQMLWLFPNNIGAIQSVVVGVQ